MKSSEGGYQTSARWAQPPRDVSEREPGPEKDKENACQYVLAAISRDGLYEGAMKLKW